MRMVRTSEFQGLVLNGEAPSEPLINEAILTMFTMWRIPACE